jgi:CDP-glycerol glycerophosphotransferase
VRLRRARRIAARIGRAMLAEWYAAWRRRPVDPDVVLFESFGGNGASCNPEALFRALHRAEDLRHLTSVWALDARSAAVFRAEFHGDTRVRVVRRGGPAYWRWLATAGTLVNNATFPPEFDRRPEQTYCNTWHGTPLKRMGFDEPDGAYVSANVVRNFLQATHLLTQSPWMTDRMYRSAYRLDGFAPARVLDLGYPRNDRLVLAPHEGDAIRARLRAAHLRPDDGIVLYAPTWRGARFAAPEDHSASIARAAAAMQRALVAAGSAATVIVQPHQAVRAFAEAEPMLDGMLAPLDLPVNSLLAVTDVLVSDYSSIVVDFLATGRPIVFAQLDGDAYRSSRGLYVDPSLFPGRRCTTIDGDGGADSSADLGSEVVRALRDGIHPDDAEHHRAMAATLVPSDDGRASDRVLDVLFRHRIDAARPTVHLDDRAERPRLLVHLGGMRSNGITSAALNLLPALVDAGIDVTTFAPRSNTADARTNRARIDPRVRQLQRIGGMNGRKFAHAKRKAADRRVDPSLHRRDPELSAVWDAEWHRCFGDARFDAVVDFSGYSPFWATLLLHAPEPVLRSIWMHNDMRAEVERLVGGRPRMRRSLRGVMGLYAQYDRVVAVSEALRAHNAGVLTELLGVRTVAARNLIDEHAVRAGATVAPAAVLSARDGAEAPTPIWLHDLDRDDLTWFACIGRLSPEKNHERLLAAFALVHADRPDTRLLIVGDGWLRPTLEQTARALEIADAVVFAGAVPNPYPFMARADCVVVSSDHEGQPMVILEAAVLGQPIVATRFESATDALPGEHLRLVDRTPRALAVGMRAFLADEVPHAALDARSYNAEALQEFLHATLDLREDARERAREH